MHSIQQMIWVVLRDARFFIPYIAAMGVWPALPITGYVLFRYTGIHQSFKSFSPLTAFALLTIGGVAFWSFPMAIAAASRIYSGTFFGCTGWLIVLVFVWMKIKGRTDLSSCFSRFTTPDSIIAIVIVICGFAYLYNPAETIEGGRDMGVYANHGIYIAHHGRLDIPYPWTGSSDSTIENYFEGFLGFFNTKPAMTVQFAHLYPVWLAQTFSSFDFQGMIRFNGIAALFVICIMYGFTRMMLSSWYAIGAVLIVAMNPGQLWLSHVSMTELLTQFSLWSGFLMLVYGLKERDKRFAAWAGILFGLSIWIRVDIFILIPLLAISHTIDRINIDDIRNVRSEIWYSLYKTMIPVFLAAVLFHCITSLPYLEMLSGQLMKIFYFLVLSVAVLIFSYTDIRFTLRKIIQSKAFIIALTSGIILLVIYAYSIRPLRSPFALMPADNGLVRDFREESLLNLAKYLSLPVIFMAPIGLITMCWSILRKRSDVQLIPLLTIAGGFSFLYLWNPSIMPDHFWAIRRYIPVIIPCFSIFSVAGASWIIKKYFEKIERYILITALIAIVGFMVFTDRQQMMTRENNGLYKQMKLLADKLPPGKTILADESDPWSAWVTPMYVSFDRKVIPVDLDNESGKKFLLQWLRQPGSNNESHYVIYERSAPLGGLKIRKMDEALLHRTIFEHTNTPLPHELVSSNWDVRIYGVDGISTNLLNYHLGGTRYINVGESGFYDPEGSNRWTDGNAQLHIPLNPMKYPSALRIEIASTGPKGTSLMILANGVNLFQKDIPAGPWIRTLSLNGVPLNDSLHVCVISTVFRPMDIFPDNQDPRKLGVMLTSVIMMSDTSEPTKNMMSPEDYNSFIMVNRSGETETETGGSGIPVQLTVGNDGAHQWNSRTGSAHDSGAVRVGVRWFREDKIDSVICEDRIDLPYNLMPGEHVSLHANLHPSDRNNVPLPPGDYRVEFGILQEQVCWFRDKGDNDAIIPIKLN